MSYWRGRSNVLRANGFGGHTQCTGTYVSERVVVTAAHCMRNDQIPGQLFVYHGKDYLDDQADLAAEHVSF